MKKGSFIWKRSWKKSQDPETIHLLARAYYDQGQFQKAEASLQLAEEPTPLIQMLAAKIALALGKSPGSRRPLSGSHRRGSHPGRS